MALIGAVAGGLLGPAAPVLQSVFGSVVQTVAGAAAQGVAQAASGVVGGQSQAVGGVATGMQTVLEGIQQAFGKLFGQKSQKSDHLQTCPHRPPAFGGGSTPGNVMQNPMQFLSGLQGMFGQIGKMIQDLVGKFPGLQPALPGFPGAFPGIGDLIGGGGRFPGVGGGSPGVGGGFGPGGGSGVGGGSGPGGGGGVSGGNFGFLDGMQGQIESLMQSDKPSDQIKAQQLMNQFSRIIEGITAMLAKLRDVQSKITQNLAR